MGMGTQVTFFFSLLLIIYVPCLRRDTLDMLIVHTYLLTNMPKMGLAMGTVYMWQWELEWLLVHICQNSHQSNRCEWNSIKRTTIWPNSTRLRVEIFKLRQLSVCILHSYHRSIIGPIIWDHGGPLCHALSLLSLLLWKSMRRRRATVAACDSSDTWSSWWTAM